MVSYIEQDHHNMIFYNMLKFSATAYKVWELIMTHSFKVYYGEKTPPDRIKKPILGEEFRKFTI